MKTIKVYEFKDLSKEIQKEIIEKDTNEVVEMGLSILNNTLSDEKISEEDYYNELGCDKNYAETTSWFIPSCYYDKHKEEVDLIVKESVKKGLYTKQGKYIEEIK